VRGVGVAIRLVFAELVIFLGDPAAAGHRGRHRQRCGDAGWYTAVEEGETQHGCAPDDATYWLTDGSYHGIDAIKAALERTFTTILDEIYTIDKMEWVAVCRYRYRWTGVIDGAPASGHGRGTMLHEHLSR
jgi:hypothetical protein